MSDAHISVQNLSVRYGSQVAVQDVSVDIPRHEITAILGPSGCGKTTLLKSMNRFLELTPGARLQGRVTVDGQDIYDPAVDVTLVRRRVGLLSQRPYPLPMSIFDNVAYGLRLHHLRAGRKLESAVQHYLELAGLWEEVHGRLHAPATRLSAGQQQRLCLARGLAVEPEVLLLDEPTSALDPISAAQIEKRFVDLKARYTLILVTHILRQARRLADHVVFMYMGELVEAGPAAQVFREPQQARTRAYINGEF
jgi:phosphate transport system ATP-binding protein